MTFSRYFRPAVLSQIRRGLFPQNGRFLGILGIFSAFLVFWAYGDTCHYDFVFDDWNGVVNNPAIRDFFADSGLRIGPLIQFGGERILGFLSFAVSWHRHGADPCGFRQVNIWMHLASTFFCGLIADLLVRVSTRSVDRNVKYIAAFSAAGLFAVHPIQTQAVTYIYQRLTGMAGMFSLMAFWAALRWLDSGRRWILFFAVFFYGCALYTKQNAILLPVLIVIASLFFSSSSASRWRGLLAFLIPVTGIPVLMVLAGGSLAGRIGMHGAVDLSSWDYWIVQGRVIWKYIYLIIWPVELSAGHVVSHGHAGFSREILLGLLGWFAIFLIVLFCCRLIIRRKHNCHPLVGVGAFGILWFFIFLQVESSVIPIRDLMMEHRIYLPFAGIAWAISALIEVTSRISILNKLPRYRTKRIFLAFIVLGLVALGSLAERRNRVWADGETLWTSVLNTDPENPRALLNLGNAYTREGRFGEAVILYDRLLKVGELRPDGLYQKSLVLLLLRDFAGAAKIRETLVEEYPGEVMRVGFLDGLELLQTARPGRAEQVFAKWERILTPSGSESGDSVGRTWLRAFRLARIRAVEKILTTQTGFQKGPKHHSKSEVGSLISAGSDWNSFKSLLWRILSDNPRDMEARIWLARTLAKLDSVDEATRELRAGFTGSSRKEQIWLRLVLSEITENPEDPEVASRQYRQLLSEFPDDLDVQLWFGGWLGVLSDNDQIHQAIGGLRELDVLADHAMAQAGRMAGHLRPDESIRYLMRAQSLCDSRAIKCTKQGEITGMIQRLEVAANPEDKI